MNPIRLFFVVLALPLTLASIHAQTAGDRLRAEIAAAAPDSIVTVPPGNYDGQFVIDKPLHFVGAPGAVLHGNGQGNVVAVRAADVEIAGFIIRGSGRNLFEDEAAIHITGARARIHDNRIFDMLHGIYVRKANDCRITDNIVLGDGSANDALADPVGAGLKAGDVASGEQCGPVDAQDKRGNGIHLWNSSGHIIERNIISGTRDGIYFSFTRKTLARDNIISHLRYGLHYMYSDENTFDRNVFSENAAGAALMFSKKLLLRHNRFVSNRSHRAYGLLLQAIDDSVIEQNTIEGNTLGLFIENGNNDTVRGNRIRDNYVGLRVNDSTENSRFYENCLAGNIHPLETTGGNTANQWSVNGRGNYWDDTNTLDLNRDGIADLPHHEPDLFGAWRRSFPAIGLLSASPGERLLRLIHSRLALPGLAAVQDPRPLINPPSLP